MATINLGSIKFKWKGTYAGGTAYTIDDVVSYNGSSYICIQASTGNLPTDTTYFEQMSQAGTNGTNGTDLTTTLTTQGDIVYRDGSGLQRLGAGTSGQVLQTGGAGANPSWGTVAGSSDAFSAYHMPSNTSGVLNCNNTHLNDGSNYNTSSGRYTAPSAGKYYFIGTAMASSSAGNLYFEKNGTALTGGTDYGYTPNNTTTGTISVILSLSANDYVTLNSQNNVYNNYVFFAGFKIY